MGLATPPDEQRAILTGFGFAVDDDWDVTVPTWRARDVTREIDVIEEVARAVLDRVPHTLPLRRARARKAHEGAAPAPERRGRPRRGRVLGGVHLEPAAERS